LFFPVEHKKAATCSGFFMLDSQQANYKEAALNQLKVVDTDSVLR
jgi:hypothetical protein